MKFLSKLADSFNRAPSDLIGVDLDPTGTRVARLRKTANGISLTDAAILSAVEWPAAKEDAAHRIEVIAPLSLPPKLKAPHAAVCLEGCDAVVKLLQVPTAFDLSDADKVLNMMGIENGAHYRLALAVLAAGHGKQDTRILAVALPDLQAQRACRTFPSGRPAPYSLELSGLGAMNSFLHGAGRAFHAETVGVAYFGNSFTSLAFFNQDVLTMFRTIDIGTLAVVERIKANLSCSEETARSMLSDGAFDISHLTGGATAKLVKQIALSRDFVERHDNCRVSKFFASGALAKSQHLLNDIKTSLHLDVAGWSPLDGLDVSAGALSEDLIGQEWQLTAAIGSCLAVFEEA